MLCAKHTYTYSSSSHNWYPSQTQTPRGVYWSLHKNRCAICERGGKKPNIETNVVGICFINNTLLKPTAHYTHYTLVLCLYTFVLFFLCCDEAFTRHPSTPRLNHTPNIHTNTQNNIVSAFVRVGCNAYVCLSVLCIVAAKQQKNLLPVYILSISI